MTQHPHACRTGLQLNTKEMQEMLTGRCLKSVMFILILAAGGVQANGDPMRGKDMADLAAYISTLAGPEE